MTHTEYTKLILNIEDNNVYFYENCLKIEPINNINTKVFRGYLTYIPEFYPKCGCINKSSKDIIKWNWKKIVRLKLQKLVAIMLCLY